MVKQNDRKELIKNRFHLSFTTRKRNWKRSYCYLKSCICYFMGSSQYLETAFTGI
jgi:hypothetical protein